MTPASQEGIWSHHDWLRPRDPEASDSAVSWTKAWAFHESPPIELDHLLDDYCGLASALPEEMAAFVARYVAPELEGLRVGDGLEGPPGALRIPTARRRPGGIPTRSLRRHARAVSAARRIAAALSSGRAGEGDDWLEVLNDLARPVDTGARRAQGVYAGSLDFIDDYVLSRQHFAEELSRMLAAGAVYTRADWYGVRRKLSLEPDAGSLVGIVAILLAREVGSEGEYRCDSCGAPVARIRPPRPGERVYCARTECKREQRRLNQAAYRARRAVEKGN